MGHKNADTVVDLETTDFSSCKGDRIIEVGAVLIQNGTVTEHFQGLCIYDLNSGSTKMHLLSDQFTKYYFGLYSLARLVF